MKRLLTIAALLSLVVAASAAFAVPPAGKGKDPASPAEAKAEKACKEKRGTTAASITAFDTEYGTNKNKKNAMGKCVSAKSKGEDKDEDDEAKEDKNKANASKECKAERGTTAESIAAFERTYGTNKNNKNAHGKCVSMHSKKS